MLTEQEARCIDLACRHLAGVYGGTWEICEVLDETYQSDASPEVLVSNGSKTAAIEVKRLLVSGDGRRTLPAFLRQHADLFFDLITIDGDKSVLGFASDLTNALPRLKIGGIVVSDDLAAAPVLRRVWQKVIERDHHYANWEFADAGFGVAAAVRVR